MSSAENKTIEFEIAAMVIDTLLQPEMCNLMPWQREDFVSRLTFNFIDIAERAGTNVDCKEVVRIVTKLYRRSFPKSVYQYSIAIH